MSHWREAPLVSPEKQSNAQLIIRVSGQMTFESRGTICFSAPIMNISPWLSLITQMAGTDQANRGSNTHMYMSKLSHLCPLVQTSGIFSLIWTINVGVDPPLEPEPDQILDLWCNNRRSWLIQLGYSRSLKLHSESGPHQVFKRKYFV